MKEIADIQKLFHPFLADRSSTLRWIIRTVWRLLFTDATVIQAFKEWQVFSCATSCHGVTQMRFDFPAREPLVTFFPRIDGGQR